MVRKTNRPDGV